MAEIFISYRRVDQDVTGRVYDRLVSRFGADRVFKDVDNIPIGTDFRKILAEAVKRCDILLVVVGQDWLGLSNDEGRRKLDDPDDFVRIEIEYALERRIPIIPVLIHDTKPPRAVELPGSIAEIAYRQVTRVRPDPDFTADVEHLCRAICTLTSDASSEPPPGETTSDAAVPAVDLGPSPYRGLSAFDVEHAELFFGRSVHVDRIMRQLAELVGPGGKGKCRIVAILGPSGNGKSSVVRAGVVARLQKTNTLEDRAISVSIMTPESRPLESLASHLARLVTSDSLPIAKSEEFLRSLERRADGGAYEGLRRIADMFVAATGTRLILVIDQFEEAYTLCPVESQRHAFIENLLDACRDPSGSLTVVLTLRSDFLAETQKHGEFDAIIAEHGILIPAMSEAELREAITEPARHSGYAFECGVVDLLVYESLDREGALPLLEFALTRIWEGLLAGQLPTETLRQVGGVGGSLAAVAEQICRRLSSDEAGMARRLFIALVQLGEGTRDTRRRVVLSQVLGHADDRSRVREVIRYFSEPGVRLITVSTSEGAVREEVIELTHEALIQHWQRLRDWLEEGRDRIRFLRRLDDAVSHWEEERCPRGLVWRTPDLDLLKRFHKSYPDELLVRHIRFLRACTGQRRRERLVLFASMALLLLVLAVGVFTVYHQRQVAARHKRDSDAALLLLNLQNAPIAEVPQVIQQLSDYHDLLTSKLREELANSAEVPGKRLRFSLALLPIDSSQRDYVRDCLQTASAEEVDVIRQQLAPHKQAVVVELWHTLETSDGERVLPVAGALAGLDPDNPRWHDSATKVARSLVSANPTDFGSWLRVFRSAGGCLVNPLVELHQTSDGQLTNEQTAHAVELLADYASNDVKVLVNLLLDATPDEYKVLLPQVKQHKDAAIALCEQEIARTLTYDWRDPPDNPGQLDDVTRSVIKNSLGVVAERFAFCQTLPLGEFEEVNAQLCRAGYRATRFRPYNVDKSVLVAAVWIRDGREAAILYGRDANDILEEDLKFRSRGYFGSDVAGYLDWTDDVPKERYAAVWVATGDAAWESWIYVGVGPGDDAHESADTGLRNGGFGVRDTLQMFRNNSGTIRYSGVRHQGRQDSPWWWRLTTRQLEQHRGEYMGLAVRDVQCLTARRMDLEAELRRRLEFGDAIAAYYLLDTAQALDRLAPGPDDGADKEKTLLRAALYSRQGLRDNAEKELAAYNKAAGTSNPWSTFVTARINEDKVAVNELLARTDNCLESDAYQWALQCVWASTVFREWDEPLAESFAQRAIVLLQRVYVDRQNEIESDVFLYPLIKYPDFVELIDTNWDDCRYAAIWWPSAECETETVYGMPPADALLRYEQLATNGFRPRAISVAAVGNDHRMQVASVWQRPLVAVEDRVSLAKRQANATLALAELGREDSVWKALAQTSDVNLRSWVVKRLGELGMDPSRLHRRLQSVLHDRDGAAECRALILALGDDTSISKESRAPYVGGLQEAFQHHIDPGVHSSAEWVLRRWDEHAWLKTARNNLLQQDMPDFDAKQDNASQSAPRWYVSSQGPTLAILGPAAPFLMGSPGSEVGRNSNERLHDRVIDHCFAISTAPITLGQFRRFRPSHAGGNTETDIPPDLDSPVVNVNWFAAAEYCNWLSQKDGLPESEWAYLTKQNDHDEQEFERAPDHLTRQGYRLPSEAEWEFACRADAATRYCFGDATELLADYGLCAFRSLRPTPIASLKPNDFGLFDVHGNVWEWCDEMRLDYPPATAALPVTLSADISRQIPNNGSRVVRGGAFDSFEKQLRSACRKGWTPSTALENLGFRVARTYRHSTLPPSPVDRIVELLAKEKDRTAAVTALKDVIRDVGEQDVFKQLIERLESGPLFEQILQDLNADPARFSLGQSMQERIRSQPALAQIHVSEALQLIEDPHPVRVAIVGDGVARYLPIFGGRVKTSDFEYARSRRRELPFGFRYNTGLAALIAAIAPAAEIYTASTGREGVISQGDLSDAIEEATRSEAKVIIVTYGGSTPDVTQQKTLEQVSMRGVLLFAGAGDDNAASCLFPAAYPGVIAVGATDLTGNRAEYSNYGTLVDLAAPGGRADPEMISTVDQEGNPCLDRGTGCAVAIAAGVAAMVLSANPDLTADEVAKILKETAVKGGGSFASGCVDALAAVQMAIRLRKDNSD